MRKRLVEQASYDLQLDDSSRRESPEYDIINFLFFSETCSVMCNRWVGN